MFKKKKTNQQESEQTVSNEISVAADSPALREENILKKEPEDDNLEDDDETAFQEDANEIGMHPDEAESQYKVDPVEAAYCLGAGIDGETLKEAKSVLDRIATSMASNTFQPEILKMALMIMNYDDNIAKARKEGYEEGRTERIETAFRNKRAKAEEAASIPRLGGTKGIGTPLGDSIFDVARQA